jgi:hypothetical protein
MAQVLLDQNVPIGVRGILRAHAVRTVYQMGWADLSNGDLLDQAAKAGFDVFVTCDQNLAFQQNLTGRKIAVVILATNRWSVIEVHPSEIDNAVASATPGEFSVVAFGRRRRHRYRRHAEP